MKPRSSIDVGKRKLKKSHGIIEEWVQIWMTQLLLLLCVVSCRVVSVECWQHSLAFVLFLFTASLYPGIYKLPSLTTKEDFVKFLPLVFSKYLVYLQGIFFIYKKIPLPPLLLSPDKKSRSLRHVLRKWILIRVILEIKAFLYK